MHKILLYILFISANSYSISNVSENSRCYDIVEQADDENCREPIEKYWLKMGGSIVKRKSESALEIKLLSGKLKTYENSLAPWNSFEGKSGEENRKYTVASIFLSGEYLLLEVRFFEGGEFLLINLKSGEETHFDGGAKISPDGKYILGYSDEVNDPSFSIVIYKITSNGTVRDFHAEVSWPEFSVRWATRSKLLITSNSGSIGKPDLYGSIELSDNQWKLTRLN